MDDASTWMSFHEPSKSWRTNFPADVTVTGRDLDAMGATLLRNGHSIGTLFRHDSGHNKWCILAIGDDLYFWDNRGQLARH